MAGGDSLVIGLADAERVCGHGHGLGAALFGKVLIAEEGPQSDEGEKAEENEKAARAEKRLSVPVMKHVWTVHQTVHGRKSAQHGDEICRGMNSNDAGDDLADEPDVGPASRVNPGRRYVVPLHAIIHRNAP